MGLICLYIDYKLAGVDTREKVAFSKSRLNDIYFRLKELDGVSGCIIISTCNRTELYINCQNTRNSAEDVLELIKNFCALNAEDVKKIIKVEGKEAIRRIFNISAGLESMIIGEDQILSQVKEAYMQAMEMNMSDSILNRIFRDAVTCAKEIKTKTYISQNKLSIASIAVDMIEEKAGKLEGKRVLVLGAGEMTRLAVQYLYDKGVRDIVLANRTPERTRAMEEQFPWIGTIGFDHRYQLLKDTDIIISATAAPHSVLSYDSFKLHYGGKNMVAVDMAVPRDIDERISGLPGVTLFDIDHFRTISDKNAQLRMKLSEYAQSIIEEYLIKLNQWLDEVQINQLMAKVDKYSDTVVSEQAEALLYKLQCGELLKRDEASRYAKLLTNRILKKLVLKIKEMSKDSSEKYADMLEELLGEEN